MQRCSPGVRRKGKGQRAFPAPAARIAFNSEFWDGIILIPFKRQGLPSRNLVGRVTEGRLVAVTIKARRKELSSSKWSEWGTKRVRAGPHLALFLELPRLLDAVVSY